MARKRMIDPNIWESEDFSSLSMLGKVIFIGLFSLADDDGRGRGNPAYIRSKLFPYSTDEIKLSDVEDAFRQIEKRMSVVFYDVGDAQYYALSHWEKWQKIDHKTASSLPSPEDSTSVRRAFDESSVSVSAKPLPNNNKNIKEYKENIRETYMVENHFDEFWSIYPKKVKKQDAMRAWNRIDPSEDLAKTILTDVSNRVKSSEWTRENGKYIPHPTTYLNGRRWEDEQTEQADVLVRLAEKYEREESDDKERNGSDDLPYQDALS